MAHNTFIQVLIALAVYHGTQRLLERYATPWLLRRAAAKARAASLCPICDRSRHGWRVR